MPCEKINSLSRRSKLRREVRLKSGCGAAAVGGTPAADARAGPPCVERPAALLLVDIFPNFLAVSIDFSAAALKSMFRQCVEALDIKADCRGIHFYRFPFFQRLESETMDVSAPKSRC